jgi:hypothetical protein
MGHVAVVRAAEKEIDLQRKRDKDRAEEALEHERQRVAAAEEREREERDRLAKEERDREERERAARRWSSGSGPLSHGSGDSLSITPRGDAGPSSGSSSSTSAMLDVRNLDTGEIVRVRKEGCSGADDAALFMSEAAEAAIAADASSSTPESRHQQQIGSSPSVLSPPKYITNLDTGEQVAIPVPIPAVASHGTFNNQGAGASNHGGKAEAAAWRGWSHAPGRGDSGKAESSSSLTSKRPQPPSPMSRQAETGASFLPSSSRSPHKKTQTAEKARHRRGHSERTEQRAFIGQ